MKLLLYQKKGKMLFPLSVLGLSTKATEYYFDRRVHNLGNVGLGGAVHAAVAPAATALIDQLAYGGRDVRRELLERVVRPGDRVVDLACGTGTSTHPRGVGVDTSAEMLRVARRRAARDARFVRGNAETFGDDGAYDVATVFFALHEMPGWARQRVLRNARRISAGPVLVCDISPRYTPSALMRTGEPYVEDYLANIEAEVAALDPVVAGELIAGRVFYAIL